MKYELKEEWMIKFLLPILILSLGMVFHSAVQKNFQEDIIPTSQGNLKITFLGHSSLFINFAGKVIHIDPVGSYADYAELPKADLVLVTHEHGDHLDSGAVRKISTDKTRIVFTQKCLESSGIQNGVVMKNGDKKTVAGINIEAVPAYNIQHMRSPGVPFHPKGVGNGYILTLGDQRIYLAGDTENTLEMKALKDIDVAFLPMNLPYTMTPEMVADAAKAFRPHILYPYHYGNTDPQKLVELLKEEKDIEVRIRDMK
jgi:L-ascorbate metabolism protein UlaG (beta-lactamase superfamily)